jgi:ABC-type branched-subunit amino acid transport system ATPase component/ABC-type branched-subunit amino acid transport system permease subunit
VSVLRDRRSAAWLAGAVLAVLAAWVLGPRIGRYYVYMLALAGIYTVVGHGLNLLVGYTGQTSLGHAGFYAIGAYTGAILQTQLGLGFWSALPAAIAVAAAAGVLVALPALAAEGPYVAMVTIAFGIIVHSTVVEWADLTGGTQGVLGIPKPAIAGATLALEAQLVLIVAVAAVTTLLVRSLVRSPWGRAFVAVRENPVAAQAIGLGTRRVKAVAFTLSAALAGAGGHLFAALQGFISPEAFEFDTSIFFLILVIFGGQGTLAGPLVGAPILTFLPELLQRFADYRLIIYGAIIVASLYALPLGVVGSLARHRRAGSGAGSRHARAEGPASPAGRAPAGPVVAVEAARLQFGGVRALGGVSLEVAPGTVHALIGPNGAGKTALLNVLCGYYRPSSGAVRVTGQPVTGMPPDRVARLGVARTFQTTQLFGALSVLDNVLAAFPGQTRGRFLDCLVGTPRLAREEARRRDRALALLGFVGYPGPIEAPAGSLPFGHQRLVEIARALALDPVLLALDEPAAGLTPAEVEALDGLVARIRARGIAVLLVEHHMELVMGVSDRVTVLDSGERLAEGSPAAVQRDPRVVRAYLGDEDPDAAVAPASAAPPGGAG